MTTVIVPAPTTTSVVVGPDAATELRYDVTPPPTIVVEECGGVVLSTPASSTTQVQTEPETSPAVIIETQLNAVLISTPNAQGPAGPPGPIGGQPTYTASMPLSGHRVVKIVPTDAVEYADCTNATDAFTIVGLTTQAYSTSAVVTVQTTGLVTHSGWSWVVGHPVILGLTGFPTQSIPVGAAFVKQIGVALSPTTIALNFSSPAVNI